LDSGVGVGVGVGVGMGVDVGNSVGVGVEVGAGVVAQAVIRVSATTNENKIMPGLLIESSSYFTCNLIVQLHNA
jgi:hypothetical protein